MSASMLDADFLAVREYLVGTAGLVFDESRRAGLSVVVAERLRATRAATVTDYLRLLTGPRGADERQRLIDLVTVQETYFFRNPPQIEALRRRVLPDLLRRTAGRERPLTIWSAGCSTGEEAYTLAMLVADLAPRSAVGGRDGRPAARILATDVSASALATADRATYSGRTLQTVSAVDRDRWFVPGAGKAMAVRDDVRRLVELRQHNLVTDPPPLAAAEVDLIVCRNVTIYFSRPTTRAVIGSFHDVLNDGGYLLLGHSETLWQVSDAFTLVPLDEAFLYRREGATRAGLSATEAKPGRFAAAKPGRSTAAQRGRSSVARSATLRRLWVASPSRPAPGALVAPVAPRPPSAQDSLAAARQALTRGDYREAVGLAEQTIAAEPLLAEAYVVLAHARSTIGLDAQAVEPLRKAVYLDPSAGHAHFLLAGALSRLGQHGPAAVSYRAASRSLPSVPEPILRTFLGGRSVSELADVCERLGRAATDLQAAGDALAPGQTAS